MAKIILDLYGGTGSWSRPYDNNKSYKVYNITQPYYDMLKTRYIGNKIIFCGGTSKPLELAITSIYGILAAPPCTEFSPLKTSSGAKPDYKTGLATVDAALKVVRACMAIFPKKLAFWALENPAQKLRYFLGDAPLVFDPCDFGDPWTKKTAIWGYYNLPEKHKVKPLYDDFADVPIREDVFGKLPDEYDIPKGWTRAQAIRSQTPKGFAKAFFNANR